MEAENIDGGVGYGIFFEMRVRYNGGGLVYKLGGTMFFTNYDKYSTIR